MRYVDPLLFWSFRFHDGASAFLVQHLARTKSVLLLAAHASLFGFFFPELRRDFGEAAIKVLLVILFLSPLSQIFRMRFFLQLMSLRRELGILMAYLATVHGLGYLLDPEWSSVFITPYLRTDFFTIEPRLLLGMLAYALTIPLLLTSNRAAQRLLGGRKWKQLHRIVYVLFIAATFHGLMTRQANGETGSALFEPLLFLGLYALAKLLAWKNILPPLRSMITYVSRRYREYQLPVSGSARGG